MQQVLVTGGAGYIGSHCCLALKEAGYRPVVFDNLSTGHRSFVRWGPLIEGDIRSCDVLAHAVEWAAPVAVIHLAAKSLVSESLAEPEETFAVNVGGTLNLLAAMAKAKVPHLVLSSTCAVYGVPQTVPIREETPLAPINPYGASKAMAERMIADVSAAQGMTYAALRYFNAAGATPSGEVGEWHDPETHLVPIALDVALGRRAALTMFGGDHPTADGTAVRDYVHVTDLARAHVRALEFLRGGGASTAFNVGTGMGASVAEVARTVERVTGRRLRVMREAPRPGDAPMLVADPARAEKVLEWRAEHGLETAVRDAWHWHRNNHAGDRAAA